MMYYKCTSHAYYYFSVSFLFLTLESVYGDEGAGFGRNDFGIEVGKVGGVQVPAEHFHLEE